MSASFGEDAYDFEDFDDDDVEIQDGAQRVVGAVGRFARQLSN